jgi:hypothetical protein
MCSLAIKLQTKTTKLALLPSQAKSRTKIVRIQISLAMPEQMALIQEKVTIHNFNQDQKASLVRNLCSSMNKL